MRLEDFRFESPGAWPLAFSMMFLVFALGAASATHAQLLEVPGSEKPVVQEAGEQRYIVRFVEAPVASYRGGVPGLRAPVSATGDRQRLNVASDESQAYRNWLIQRQLEHLGGLSERVRRSLQPERSHQLAINAVTLRMTPAEAAALAQADFVAHVEPDRALPLNTDYGPGWIEADQLWDGTSLATEGTHGEGILVGIIDTGINFTHPSFAQIAEDNYIHTNPLGSGTYLGWCDPANANHDAAYACNDKLIGAWDYADSSWNEEADGPVDNAGHGSHVASTVAGNPLSNATLQTPTVSVTSAISGVAPRANLIAYDVCAEFCNTSDVVAALDQAIADGVDVLNESIGIGGDVFQGAKQQAYLGVLDAGIMAVRSAGNSGPGAGSLDTEPVWTTSVAAASHSRAFVNAVTGLSGGESSLADISGVSLTSSYGPAAIVDAVDKGDGLCLEGFEAGTWSGEIVICTRGQIGRVQKGINVKAGGAGGLILVDDGSGLVADAHELPAVHITTEDGLVLRTWLASGINHQGQIAGTTTAEVPAGADVLAGFSSRGPLVLDVIKPDLTAPGVAILAAVAADGEIAETYGVYSGTSMASPHVAGAAALLRAIHPTWTPSEIRSALMGTALPGVVRTEALAEATPFDAGSGRIDVERAARTGLLMNESAIDFLAADPSTGGDPRTLNLPSLQNGVCVRTCSWQRTVTNAVANAITWEVSYQGDGQVAVTPSAFTLGAGQERALNIQADLSLVDPGVWQFGRLVFETDAEGIPAFTIPLAARAAISGSALEFQQSVDQESARPGDELLYTFSVAPFYAGDYRIVDPLPEGLSLVMDSSGEDMSYDPQTGILDWSARLGGASLELGDALNSPAVAYQPLSELGVEPFLFQSTTCDDGGLLIPNLDFRFQGRQYTQLIWSINGTLEPGGESLSAASPENSDLPNGSLPGLLAPLWTDLTVCDRGALRATTVTRESADYHVFEWDQVPLFGAQADAAAFSFQVWIETGTENFWFVYGGLGPEERSSMTIGAQFGGGASLGRTLYFNGEGSLPTPGDGVYGRSDIDRRTLSFRGRVADGRTGFIINTATLEDESGRDAPVKAWTRVELPLFFDRFE